MLNFESVSRLTHFPQWSRTKGFPKMCDFSAKTGQSQMETSVHPNIEL